MGLRRTGSCTRLKASHSSVQNRILLNISGRENKIDFFEYSTRLGRKLRLHREKCGNKWAHVYVDLIFVDRSRSKIWITHQAVPTREWIGKRGGMIICKACSASLKDIAQCLWSCPRAQEVWTRSLRILARCGPDVHVLRTTVTWLATESAMWFQGWNGNSPLKSIEIYYKCQDLYQIMDYHILGRMLTTLSYNRTTRANSLIWLRSLHEK